MKLYLRFVFGLFFLFLISTYSHANVFYVTNTNDAGAGSLRDQVLAANNGDSVVFAVSGQVNILSPLIFNKTVIIIGATAKHNTIHFQGGNFQLNSAFTVVFQKLRFIENVTGDFRFTSSNSGDFEFYDCLFENFTDENNDGAVFSVHGSGTTLMVENCGFFNNTAVYNGGVLELFNQAFAQFRNCTFFNNTAAFGGVFFPNTNTTLHLINNTFLNNSSVLYNATTDNTIVINNNIFSSPNPMSMFTGSATWTNLGGNVYSDTFLNLDNFLGFLGIPNTASDTYAGNQTNIQLRATPVADGYGLKWIPIVNSASVAVENGVASAYTAIDVDGRRAPRTLDGDLDGVGVIDAGACEYTPYRVTSFSGAGSFSTRFSLANSNHLNGPIYIEFDAATPGNETVSGLITTVAQQWVIDGFTQSTSSVPGPGSTINTIIPGVFPNSIDGNIGPLLHFIGVGNNSSLSGFQVTNDGVTSVRIENSNEFKLFGNLIGSAPNLSNIGVHSIGCNNNLIGGSFHHQRNVINGSFFSTFSTGLLIETGNNNKAYGNIVGLTQNGTVAKPNDYGIVIGFGAEYTTIGGAKLFQRNTISGNNNTGVIVTSGATMNNKIESNYIGLNYSGTAAIGNAAGVVLDGGTNYIGNYTEQRGNVISGNGTGIIISGSLNEVYGNIIGLNPSANAKIANTNQGIEIFGSSNKIGNDYAIINQRNIISGNGGRGILINGSSASSNLIYGNLIGPLADGINVPIGNQSNGIELVGGATNNEVGGLFLDFGNVISGNDQHGISIFNGSSFNTIRSNNIGVDKSESIDIPNGSVGIQLLTDCNDNTISNNMVSRNGTNGIEINASHNNTILDNVIGCNRDVTANFGNTESGITLFNSSGTYIEENNIHSNGLFGIDMLGSNSTQLFTNYIGGTAISTEPYVGSGNANKGVYVDQSDSVQIGDGTNSRVNYIKFNGGNGIEISGGSSLVQHTYNFISNNTGLGIDIDADGVSVAPTDNEGAQAPVFSGAVDCSGTVTITGTLNGTPSTMYRLDFYKNINPDASGSGEGETYIEKTYVITDGAGVTNFNHIFSSSVFAGDIITAIASDSINGFSIRNSSEFAINILVQSPPSTTLVSTTNETCAGTMNGAIDVSVSGGITPYTYTWLNSASSIVGSSEDVSGLGADNYYLEVEDATGCLTISSIYNIISPPAFTVSVSATDASCAGGSDGTATSVEVGGTGPFTYLWSPGGQTTQTINGLIQGSYDVTVTDANGCVQMNSGFVFEPSPMMLTFTPTDPSCFGSSDGVLTVNVTSGGTAPFGYFWTPSSSTFQTVSGLSSGTYTCQVTDANGCIQSDNVSLTDPTQLILTQDAQTNVTCFGSNDGSATVGATGNAPFTYSWSPFGGTSPSATSLTAQNYTVTVTDNNGCTAQENFNITEPVALNATVVPTNESCIGNFDGSAVVEINSGGSIPFVVQLYASGDLLVNTENSVNYSDPRTFTGLAPDNYYVVFTDNSGCKDTLLFDIFQGQLLTANFSSPATGCVSSVINFTDLSTSSPTPTGWLWDFGDANTSTLQNPTHTYATAGSYIVTLTTFWGSCTETFNNAIIINSIPLLTNASSATICSNTSPSFAITSDISATYEWFATDNINVTGESLTSQFSNTITDNLVNTLNTPQNITYTAIPTSLSGCVGSSSIITITVNPLPVMTVPSSLTICSGDNVNLPLTSTVAANYNWSATSNILVSGESTFIQTTSLINDVIVNPTVVPEIVNYSVSGTSLTGTCSGPVFSVSVTINPTPATPVITTNSPLCVGSTLTLNTSLVAGASYAWSGPNGFTSAVQNPTISGITSAGAGVYNLTITQNGCTSSSASSTVVVDPAPTVAFAGSNMSICQNIGTLTMAANAPTVGVGSWSFISGPGTPIIVSTLSPNSVINGLSIPGSYIFQWSISNGVCTPSTSQVTITVNANPSMPTASNNGPICEGNNLLLSTPLVAGASYSWSGPNGFTSTVQNPVISIVTAAANGTYSVTTTVNGCASLNAGTTVATINAAPTTSIAGTDQTICINSPSATMAANFPINGTGAWSFVSGPATPTFSNGTDPTTTVNGLVNPGTYVFDWIISSVGCVPSSDQIIITIDNLPTTALLGVDTTACSTLNTTTLFGNTPTSGTGLWSQISGPTATFGSPTSNITSVSGLNTAGTYVFQWTISNGVCPTSSDQKVITLNPGPTLSDAGIDQNVCINVATATMAANTPIIGSGAWSFVSGPATPSFVTINSPTTNVNGLINPGTYIFDWVISSVGCTPSTDQMVVIVDNLPTAADAGLDTTACATLGTMTLFGNNPTIGTGSWIQLSGPVTTISTPNSNVTSVTGLNTAGTYIYQWTTSNGVCSISTDQKVVTLNPGPTLSDAGIDKTICVSTASVNMTANSAIIGSGLWTFISGPSTPSIAGNTTPTTPINGLNTPGSYVFEWTISSAGCTPSISQVTINVDDVPTFSDAGLPQSICAGSDTITMNGNTPLVGTGSWMQVTGGVSIIDNPSSPTTIITGYVTPGTYVYDWVIGNGSCPNSSDQVTITVEEAPTTSIAGTNQDICVSAAATTLGANTPTVGIGAWSFVSGPSVPTFININSPTTSANGFMMPGVYVLEWAISNGSCAPSASQVTITVNDAPTASAAGSDQTICSTAGTVSMNANTPTIGIGAWTQISGPTSTIVNVNSPTTAINGLTTAGVYNFQWEITNGTCTPSTDVVTITVNEGPSVNATAPNNVCASESSFNVLGTQNNANSVMWSIVSGSGSLGSTTTNASVYTLGAADQGTTVILLFDGLSSSCPLASDTVYIVIDPIPNAPITTDNLNQSICEGTTVNLSASTTTSGANIFWFSNAGLTNQIGVGANVTLGPIVSNGNAYVISSLNGCVNNNPLIFNLNTITNSAEAGDSVAVCIGSTATLNGSASGNFYWINEVGLSDTTILNPTVNPTVETYYYLVSNNGGCTAIDSVLVYIITDCETIQVTNSFSPNGDGVNDFFTIDGLNNSVALRVTILNRWGDIVADISNYDNILSRWDGTYNGSPVPEGTYFYIIEYLEGIEPSTGWVQVLR